MKSNFTAKIGEIGRLTFIRRLALAFLNGVEYRNFDFKRSICNDLATLRKNFVNFGPVISEFKRVKGVHTLVYQQFPQMSLDKTLRVSLLKTRRPC